MSDIEILDELLDAALRRTVLDVDYGTAVIRVDARIPDGPVAAKYYTAQQEAQMQMVRALSKAPPDAMERIIAGNADVTDPEAVAAMAEIMAVQAKISALERLWVGHCVLGFCRPDGTRIEMSDEDLQVKKTRILGTPTLYGPLAAALREAQILTDPLSASSAPSPRSEQAVSVSIATGDTPAGNAPQA